MSDLLPLFLNVTGRPVALVGGGRVAAGKLQQLLAAGARVTVVAPAMSDGIRSQAANVVELRERPFAPSDLDGVWLVVAAATPEVNRAVAAAAEARRLFVNAVDDPANATAYLSGVVRRDMYRDQEVVPQSVARKKRRVFRELVGAAFPPRNIIAPGRALLRIST